MWVCITNTMDVFKQQHCEIQGMALNRAAHAALLQDEEVVQESPSGEYDIDSASTCLLFKRLLYAPNAWPDWDAIEYLLNDEGLCPPGWGPQDLAGLQEARQSTHMGRYFVYYHAAATVRQARRVQTINVLFNADARCV